MASAKQIAWRKKFARMSKAGAFKKTKKSKSKVKNTKSNKSKSKQDRETDKLYIKLTGMNKYDYDKSKGFKDTSGYKERQEN